MTNSKKSFLNAIAAFVQMFVVSVIGLIFNKTILNVFGSDYNGINSSITQIISILMILEGGFSLASNVALFKPYGDKDFKKVNEILSATKKRFLNIGLIAFFIGLVLTVVYPYTVTSTMTNIMIMALMLTALIPVSYNIAFNMKYRVMVLTDQKEYILSIITSFTYLIGNVIAIILMNNGFSILVGRISIMVFLLINYWLISLYCKKHYRFIDFSTIPNFNAIKGTKNVTILKVTSVVYSTFPIVIISTIPGLGPLLASVYAVYKSVTSVIKESLVSITNAPRLAFGALLSKEKPERISKYFDFYELISILGLSIILGTASLLIMPFVNLYTSGVYDIQYNDNILAVILLLTVFLEIIHIPSGQIIQMKGEFNISRRIQSIALTILIIFMVLGRFILGFYGIVISVLLAALSLTIMEISYVRKHIFKRSITKIGKRIIPSLLICLIGIYFGFNDFIILNSYIQFIIIGFISILGFTITSLGVYYIIDSSSTKELYIFIENIFKKK